MKSIAELFHEITLPQTDYTEAKKHAEHVDALLGFSCHEIEAELIANKEESSKQLWLGLGLQSLQTPYSEIVDMLKQLNPDQGESWIDLGAAYGRMAIVLNLLRPDLRFAGYEYVQARVEEGKRILQSLNLDENQLQCKDLVSPDFKIQQGDVFFLYDFGSREEVYLVIEKLRKYAIQKPIRVITRGRAVKSWLMMDFPWLSEVHPPEHFGNWSLFRS
jgi:hypothetical protein